MSLLISENTLRNIQLVAIVVLIGGAIGLVGSGVFIYGYDSDYTKELLGDLKLIVMAGVLAAFALMGLGRRVPKDKST